MRLKSHLAPDIAQMQEEVDETLQSFGYELVQLKAGGTSGNRTLTVLMDKPDGVTAADCKYMAKRLSVLLESMELVDRDYRLVVSSPGVDRPLTRDTDFTRFAGRDAAVRWSAAGAKPKTVSGVLRGLDEGKIRMEADGEEVLIPLEEVESANLVYDWDEDPFMGSDSE